MSAIVDAVRTVKGPRNYYIVALLIALIWAALAIPGLNRSRTAALNSTSTIQPAILDSVMDYRAYSAGPGYSQVAFKEPAPAVVQWAGVVSAKVMAPSAAPDAAAGRRIVRTASMDIVVQHPGEIADRIAAIAEKMGGYLVSADGGGQSASTAHVTIRVPAAQFEEARAEIRELGARVESEKFDAQDVTRQYVDQEASIRNLQAEEMQYLAILNRANDVNSMLMVAGKLSDVRGQIEKLQAEANSSLQQTGTVSLAVALRTEAAPQVSVLDWRPLHELRAAAIDGLSSVIAYAAAMITILFYLPAALLWAGTIFFTAVLGWRFVQWLRRRWSVWTAADSAIQG